jgi:hypothetical protein
VAAAVAALNLGGRPFRIITKSISVQNLAQRVAVPQTGDELQRISETCRAAAHAPPSLVPVTDQKHLLPVANVSSPLFGMR